MDVSPTVIKAMLEAMELRPKSGTVGMHHDETGQPIWQAPPHTPGGPTTHVDGV